VGAREARRRRAQELNDVGSRTGEITPGREPNRARTSPAERVRNRLVAERRADDEQTFGVVDQGIRDNLVCTVGASLRTRKSFQVAADGKIADLHAVERGGCASRLWPRSRSTARPAD
jgi:hypothetical protein